MIYIAPSLLSADFSKLQEEVKDIEQGGADWLHLDVMDGHFVPNITFGPGLIKALRPHSNLFFDVHLMIENPDKYIQEFADSGADMIVVHAEACTHLHRTIQSIHATGKKAGVALNPATSLSVLDYILPDVDMVLLMSVNPGFGGQKFINIVPKLERLMEMCKEQGVSPLVQVDGGITSETAPLVVNAGANVLVAGSAVFGKPDRKAAIEALR
ncbi:MAG: ribulose-phosphate 3-epimerase [Peptococcaceae bacterium]|nr:ribulose-phosphate 3-epimerase [Peptococcaceae bacterium]MBQ2995270.1 ribulose-phosphate 3-epimerase [Peptococcaceae bacterium]